MFFGAKSRLTVANLSVGISSLARGGRYPQVACSPFPPEPSLPPSCRMTTLLHFDSPMLTRAPAEKENQVRPSAVRAKHGGGAKEAQPAHQRRMALKAINGENYTSPAAPLKTPAKTGGRIALSNLTNTSGSGSAVQKTPLLNINPSGGVAIKGTPSVKSNIKRKTKPRPVVPDIEQAYPKKVVPVLDDIPRLPHNWTAGLPLDLWAIPSTTTLGPLDESVLNLSVETLPLPECPGVGDDDLPVFLTDTSAFQADLERDLAEDARSFAAELLAISLLDSTDQ